MKQLLNSVIAKYRDLSVPCRSIFCITRPYTQISLPIVKKRWHLIIIGRGCAKYRDLSVTSRSIICRSRRPRQVIDLQDTDKSRYFAQPRPIIVKCHIFVLNYRKAYLRMGTGYAGEG